MVAVHLDAMLKALALGLLISSLLISVTAENGFLRCNCDDERSFWKY